MLIGDAPAVSDHFRDQMSVVLRGVNAHVRRLTVVRLT